jgi:deoxyribodipyrimidine photolyase-related protein
MNSLFEEFKNQKVQTIHYTDPTDWAVEKRLNTLSNSHNIDLKAYKSPGFLCTREYIRDYFDNKDKYLQTSFYIDQRKRMNILMKDRNPIGGKWTFDVKNRKKIPKNLELPQLPHINMDSNKYVQEAKTYVEDLFPDNPGELDEFFYPIDYESAWKWFQTFLEDRFEQFGPYEDAMQQGEILLFHSLLSPLLNSGLITPEEVIKKTISYSKTNKIPINSLEGFIRQILGWREFIRAVYLLEGVNERNSNHWNHTQTIPKAFYTAETNILPIDNIIQKLLQHAYLHHIERLMLLANFMTLCEIHPDEIYRWFMELFIDAYDWVMVPNVYGMSTYADGGLITTKPYVSSSNYVRKMSDYPKGEWCDIWDALYWRFIHKHRETFKNNPRMSLMVNILNKKDKNDLNHLLDTAENYLTNLHKNL